MSQSDEEFDQQDLENDSLNVQSRCGPKRPMRRPYCGRPQRPDCGSSRPGGFYPGNGGYQNNTWNQDNWTGNTGNNNTWNQGGRGGSSGNQNNWNQGGWHNNQCNQNSWNQGR